MKTPVSLICLLLFLVSSSCEEIDSHEDEDGRTFGLLQGGFNRPGLLSGLTNLFTHNNHPPVPYYPHPPGGYYNPYEHNHYPHYHHPVPLGPYGHYSSYGAPIPYASGNPYGQFGGYY